MAYKDMILGTLTQTAVKEGDNTYFEMAQEVEEVYRKAKAFDAILDIDEFQHEEEWADNAMNVINKYKEDTQND